MFDPGTNNNIKNITPNTEIAPYLLVRLYYVWKGKLTTYRTEKWRTIKAGWMRKSRQLGCRPKLGWITEKNRLIGK